MADFTSLPVYRHRQDILDALERNQTIIVESPTGSGKTTQIPLILREAGYDRSGIIGITQPRRIAAMSVSEFIRKQIGDSGAYCGYKMRFADTTGPDTRIKIMTDGILLQEVKLDKTLSRYSVIMVDEAHERSLNIDFILGLLKEISLRRPDLKIIISSATINAASFAEFFGNAPIISIDSRPYEVEVRYDPAVLSRDTEYIYWAKVSEIVRHTVDDGNGDILIFLPGEAEIKACIDELEHTPFSGMLEIYPLYGRLSKDEQERVFTPTSPGKCKVVVSTNIAETSLTIDGIRTVIDSGMAKVNFYNQKNFTSALLPLPISRASADQRKGRAGRTAPGICYRLYTEMSYDMRPQYSEEEILHSDLAEVVLRMSELEIYNTDSFPFITPPKKSAMQSAEETLLTIGAIEKDHHLTSIGSMMIQFPLLPRLSRIIVEAIMGYPDVMEQVLIAVATMSAKTPYVLPPGEELEARDAHRSLRDPVYGDFLSMVRLFRRYADITDRRERKAFCKSKYLDYETMEEIQHIKTQLEAIVSEMGMPISSAKESHTKIAEYFMCLMTGLKQYVCMKIDRFSYRSLTADSIMIHPGSAWFSELPQYILAGEIVQTTKMYARTVSPIQKSWVEAIVPELIAGRRSLKAKERKDRERSLKESLEQYRTRVGSKDVYVIPLKDAQSMAKAPRAFRFYLSISGCLSKALIPSACIGKELSLIPKNAGISKAKLKGRFSPEAKQYGELDSMLNMALVPFSSGKKTFSFLMLHMGRNSYSLVPHPSLQYAAKETLYSLSCLIETVPKKQGRLRNRILRMMGAYAKAMDLEEDGTGGQI